MNETFSIFLVEDNPGDVDLIRSWIRKLDCHVHLDVSRDGHQAINTLHERKANPPLPNLVLLDLNLPKKSGLEVLSMIKSDAVLKRVPVVVLTSSDAPGDVNAAYDLGANCYLTKSVDLAESKDVLMSLERFWIRKAILPEVGARNRDSLFSEATKNEFSSAKSEPPCQTCK